MHTPHIISLDIKHEDLIREIDGREALKIQISTQHKMKMEIVKRVRILSLHTQNCPIPAPIPASPARQSDSCAASIHQLKN